MLIYELNALRILCCFHVLPIVLDCCLYDVCFFFWEPHETAERFGSSRSVVGPELLKIRARFTL